MMGTPKDHAGWVKRAADLRFETGLFIEGASRAAANGATTVASTAFGSQPEDAILSVGEL